MLAYQFKITQTKNQIQRPHIQYFNLQKHDYYRKQSFY
jgi:hypothetical protein